MAKHNPATAQMHPFLTRNAYKQALFMFVQGAITANPALSPRKAIRWFREQFGDPSASVEADHRMFNTMRCEVLRQNKIFYHGQNNGNTSALRHPAIHHEGLESSGGK